MSPKVFTAEYDGVCPACHDDITAGLDEITWSADEDGYVHEDCA